jgi:hypothetical protein
MMTAWEVLTAKVQEAVQAAGWSAPRGLDVSRWEWQPWLQEAQRACTRERLDVVLCLLAALVLVKLLVSGASPTRNA